MSDKIEDAQKIKKRKKQRSKLRLSSIYAAADTIDKLHGRGHVLDMETIVEELIERTKEVTDGNIKEIELMLLMQAKTLDYVFYDTLERLNAVDMLNQFEAFANIAFRAQNQSRKTLLALAELKHPRRTTFIKQQNNGINQQVNNTAQLDSKKIKNLEKVANELLSEVHHETLDFRGASETISTHQTMEAVETGGSKDTRGQRKK
jgi:hypothetical protein